MIVKFVKYDFKIIPRKLLIFKKILDFHPKVLKPINFRSDFLSFINP